MKITIPPELPRHVLDEVRATDYHDFCSVEVPLVRASHGAVDMLYDTVQRTVGRKYGHIDGAVQRSSVGFLLTHRILRYANNDEPLPPVATFKLTTFLERQASLPVPEVTTDEVAPYPEFDQTFGWHTELWTVINGLSSVYGQYSAKTLLMVMADHIERPETPSNQID